jgi:uncharacterized phage-associated protein
MPHMRVGSQEGGEMANVRDVAQYILSQVGQTSTWKLQKLVYYSQAWHSVWEDKTLFDAPIEAWANGPVCPELYECHRGQFSISRVQGSDVSRLTEDEKNTIDVVIGHYHKFNGQQLSDLTHSELPWKDARRGLAPGERGNHPIPVEAMSEFYSSF